MQSPFGLTILLLWQAGVGGLLLGCLPVVFILFILMLGGLLVYYAYKRAKKRKADLRLFASQNGWTYVDNAAIEGFQNWTTYSIFTSGSSYSRAILNFMQKQFDGGQAFVFDYTYRTGGGKNSHTYTQTVLAFHSPRLNIPCFALYPESIFSFIGEAFGYNDIDFVSHPGFSKRFKLGGTDEAAIRQIFHPQILSAFETLPNLHVDGGGNYLFIYTINHQIDIPSLNNYINYAANIYGLFRR